MSQNHSLELSVVVAALNASHVLPECLAALEAQRGTHAVEVFVVTPNEQDALWVEQQHPDFTALFAPNAQLIPELWGLGAARARGRIIAITIGTCVPEAHWVERIIRAHSAPHAAIGGAIENARGASLVDWAVYFVRYSPFMLPFPAGPMEVPGDNGSYKRIAIADQLEWIAARGFWEAEVNANLRRARQTLWGDPYIIVHHQRSFGFGAFTRQRYEHGRIFGQMRAARASRLQRVLYTLSAPVIPLVLLARIVRNVLRKGRNLAPFLLSLPLIIWFLLSWSLGEWRGLLRG